MKYLSLVWKNMRRNRRRLTLTVMSIALSVFIFCTLITVVNGVDRFMSRADSSRVIMVADRYSMVSNPMPQAHLDRIREIPGVSAVMGVNFGAGIYRDEKDSIMLFAADHAALRAVLGASPGFEQISEEDFSTFERERTAALVGKVQMLRNGWNKGDTVIIKTRAGGGPPKSFDLSLKIAGVISGGFFDSRIILHRDYFREFLLRKDFANMALITAESMDKVQPMASAIESRFLNSSVPVKAEPISAFFNRFLAGFNLRSVIAALNLVIFIATVSIAANSIAMSVRERRRETAIFKTLGFSSSQVLGFILGESALIALAGGFMGAIASYVLFSSAGFFVKVGPLSYFEVPMATVARGLLGSLLIGLLSGLIPAVSSYRMQVVRALREVT